jgi:hypothetical protein
MARAKADTHGQDALHGPDQVAGGNPQQFTGMGDAGVNRSLGRQWGSGGQAKALNRQMTAALADSGIPFELWGDIRVKV